VSGILVSEEAGVRYLHFSSDWIQGAMRIARPWALELEYTREMMAGLLLRPSPNWPRHALLVGLGAGSLTKFLRRHRPSARLTVVEIEPQVVAAAQQFFALPERDEYLNIVIGDGADVLAAAGRRYDLIMIDAYDGDARSGRLDSLACYLDCRAALSEQGLLVVNLLSRRRGFTSRLNRLQEAFAERLLVLPASGTGNVVTFATAGAPIEQELAQLRIAARALKSETGLNLLPLLARLEGDASYPGGRVRL
jgi:spermidine synthase